MKTLLSTALAASLLTLAACSAPKADTATTAAATPPAAAAPSGSDAGTAGDAAPRVNADQNASADGAGATPAGTHQDASADMKGADMKGMDMSGDKSAMSSGTQAGWYTAGTFRACGSGKAMKVDRAADIDRQIKAGGMNASDPVYVKLDGMAMGDTFMVHSVSQVGSKAPVRDCPMTGGTTQVGG